MGQKTQPIGFRLGINRTWDSRWFGGKSYGDLLHQDIELRKYLFEKLKSAAVSKIVIERPAGRARITIYAGRPGLVIGKKGQDIETLKNTLSKKIHIVSILLLLFSCTLKKTSQNTLKIEPLSTNNLLDSIDKTSLNFNTLKNRASATLFFNGEKNSVKVNFRIQKDSLIWANLSKSGIQLLTSLLSEDSIKFLKKLNKKEYFFGNYTDLESIVNSTLNYQMVEDFICGNPVLIKNKDTYF